MISCFVFLLLHVQMQPLWLLSSTLRNLHHNDQAAHNTVTTTTEFCGLLSYKLLLITVVHLKKGKAWECMWIISAVSWCTWWQYPFIDFLSDNLWMALTAGRKQSLDCLCAVPLTRSDSLFFLFCKAGGICFCCSSVCVVWEKLHTSVLYHFISFSLKRNLEWVTWSK